MPTTVPIGALTLASTFLTGIAVGNAYYQKKQFYPSVVYITKSNPSLAAIYFLAFTVVILFGKLLKNIFFGTLRAAEFEQLLERSFYAVTETCLAFTVFRDDFSPKFVSLFTVLLFLKAFHYLTDSRVDFMERSPVITALFHLRVTALLLLLMLLDLFLLNYSYLSTILYGASVQLVFGFEYAILLTVGFNVAVKYICHSIDLRSENPWENKAVYLLYTELFVGLVKVILYIIFLMIMIRIHTFPLFIIRPMYLTIRSFKNALNAVIQSRRAIHNMNTLYPDASQEELSAVDNVCIICREEMTVGAKKLPCGHIFHSACLRSWFQRQQTCPTCRMDILQQPIITQQPVPPPAPQAAFQQQPQPGVQAQPMPNPFMLFGQNIAMGVRPQFPFQLPFNNQLQPQPAAGQAPPQQQATQSTPAPGTEAAASTASNNVGATASTSTSSASSTSSSVPRPGFVFGSLPPLPPFLPFMPFNIPCPPTPANFSGLTIDELRRMEGSEREAVEARIKALKNIQILLDAASIQLSQYYSVANTVGVPSAAFTTVKKEPDLLQRTATPQATTNDNKSSPVKSEASASSPSDAGASAAVDCDTTAEGETAVEADDDEDISEVRKRRLALFSAEKNASSDPSI